MIAMAALKLILLAVPELVEVLRAGKDAAPPHLRKDLEAMLPPNSKAEEVSENLAPERKKP